MSVRAHHTGPGGPGEALADSAQAIHFVMSPEGVLIADIAEKAPAQGIWLRADKDVLHTACRDGAFERAFGEALQIPGDLVWRTETLLVKRCQELLSLAQKAGEAVAGAEKVRRLAGAGGKPQDAIGLLLQARDGAERAKRDFRRLAGARPVSELLDGQELAEALGRDAAPVHVALTPGKLADGLARELTRLAGFRAGFHNAAEKV